MTYDLHNADNDDYQELYDLLDEYYAKKLTESSYLIETNDSLKVFETNIKKATKKENNVVVIIMKDKSLIPIKIR